MSSVPETAPKIRKYGSFDDSANSRSAKILQRYASYDESTKPFHNDDEDLRKGTLKRALSTLTSLRQNRYYRKQEKLIVGYETDKRDLEAPNLETVERQKKYDKILARCTLALNIILLFAKIAAAVMSSSYSVIASVIDSCVDSTAGFVIMITNETIDRADRYMYPRGRSRLEPIAIIIISTIMALASILMIVESIEAVVENKVDPQVQIVTLSIMGATVVLKIIAMIVCYRYKSPSTAILAQDHRNDCISNFVAICGAVIGAKTWKYADPLGAIVVSVYIMGTWFITGRSQIRMLSGRSANPEFISRIVKICVDHNEKIQKINTVLVYHWGSNFLVEVEVVVDETITIREAQEIAQPLKHKIQSLNYVERCFLHVDHQ